MVDINFELLNTKQFEAWKDSRKIEDKDIQIVLEKTGLARKNHNGKLLPKVIEGALLLGLEDVVELESEGFISRVFGRKNRRPLEKVANAIYRGFLTEVRDFCRVAASHQIEVPQVPAINQLSYSYFHGTPLRKAIRLAEQG